MNAPARAHEAFRNLASVPCAPAASSPSSAPGAEAGPAHSELLLDVSGLEAGYVVDADFE